MSQPELLKKMSNKIFKEIRQNVLLILNVQALLAFLSACIFR
jgi:hypothetical protein